MGEMTENALLSGALIRFNTGIRHTPPISRLGLPGTWESIGTIGVDAGDFDSIYYNPVTSMLSEQWFLCGGVLDSTIAASALSINGGGFFEGSRTKVHGHSVASRKLCAGLNHNTGVVCFGGTYNGTAYVYRTSDGLIWTATAAIMDSMVSCCYMGADGSDHIWLFGSKTSGWIYKSDDDGATISKVLSTNWTTEILSLASDSNDTGFALAGTTTDAALIYKTTDFGDTWTSKGQIAGAGESINSIAIHTDGEHCLAATSNGVYFSDDIGETWELKTAASEFFAVVFTLGSSRAFISNDQYIYYSDDYGATWSIAYSIGSVKNIKGLAINRQSSIILATSQTDGNIYRSKICDVLIAEDWEDKGAIYTLDPLDVSNGYYGKTFIINAGDNESWIAVGGCGLSSYPVTCLTTNNGAGWSQTISTGLLDGQFIGVARNPETGSCFAIGIGGYGHSWQKFTEGNVHDNDIKYTTGYGGVAYCICYAGGSKFFRMNGAPDGESTNGWYHYTSDDGTTWTSVQDTYSWMTAADSWGNGKAIAIGTYNDGGGAEYKVRMTSNYGVTWSWVAASPVTASVKTAVAVDKLNSNCYVAAAGIIYKSSDYGATWAELYNCSTYHSMTKVYDILVVPGTGVIYVSGTEKILKSTDSGRSFHAVYCSYDGKYIHSLAISDDLTSMAAMKSPDSAPTFLCCSRIA